MKDLPNKVLELVVPLVLPNAKAIVGFLVAGFVAFLADKGIPVEEPTLQALVVGASGLLTAILVWLTPNKQV